MTLDIILFILGSVLIVAGLVGCFLPWIPGPPLSYLALISLQLTSAHPFTAEVLIIYGVLTLVVTVIDYIIPIIGINYSGGTKYGNIGGMVGLAAGFLIFPIIGIIVGPFIGAVIGEMIGGKDFNSALRAAIGSFIGLLAGTFIKLVLSSFMTYYFLRSFLQIQI